MRGRAAAAVLVAVTAVLGAAGCGGDDDGGGDGGGDVDAGGEGEIDAGGAGAELHTYVVDGVDVPTSVEEAEALGFDQDDDATVDNQLGQFLTALTQAAGSAPLDFQATTDSACDRGELLLLIGLETTGLDSAASAHVSTYRGESPDPAACEDEDDTVCRRHLEGDAVIDVAADTPALDGCAGDIAGGVFDGGPPCEVIVQLAIGVGVVELPLGGARVLASDLEAASLGDTVMAGLVPGDVLDEVVLPDMHAAIDATIDADCAPVGEDCNCEVDSIGETLLAMFDDDADCGVALGEFRENDIVGAVMQPDVDTDDDDEPDAFSVGVGVTAVSATFDPP